MAFALWIDRECAWAEGTHEYRPLGVAVIAATDVFRARDFSPTRRPPSRQSTAFDGLFPSLEAINRYLRKRKSQTSELNTDPRLARIMPTI